ncbi:radical SAM protein [Oceanirhabdus sp. W0125-5]|uniref:radical SAM protein n=1 Tax=Oceanirhabdus sp. W0125-5 TaxID=2999116 RepID=UPI0022F30D6A|nr:radical SAM protein [Oceanirhabdus sp. W0125-5]WBW98103.1 4Fe-4S cluster-binding domain-containing protein [Oceanirhabdus sp. W0125-5]
MFCSNYARVIILDEKVLIYNALFGGMIMFSKEINKYIRIEGNRVVDIDDNIPSEIKNRLEKKYIVSDEGNFDNNLINKRFNILNNKAKEGELIKNLRLTLTKNCNCSCDYCYVERKYNNSLALTFEDCTKFIRNAINLSDRKEMSIRFFGGEPTLEFDLIQQIVEFVEKEYPEIKFNYLLNTNLQNITKDMVSYFKRKKIKAAVSLDSIKKTNDYNRHSLVHDSYYDEAVKQIRILSEEGVSFVVCSVVTNHSREYVPQFLEEMKDIGVKNISLNFAKMVDKDTMNLDKDLAQIFANAYKYGLRNSMNISGSWFTPFKRLLNGGGNAFCGGLGYELDLRPDKKVYTCVGETKPIADLNSMNEVPMNSLYSRIVNRVPANIGSCKGCDIEGLCAGQCACDADYASNNFFGINNEVCDFQKELLRLLIECSI